MYYFQFFECLQLLADLSPLALVNELVRHGAVMALCIVHLYSTGCRRVYSLLRVVTGHSLLSLIALFCVVS